MSEELNYKLFTPTDCIPEQTMFDYIDGKLSPKEQHAVEKHLLDCELCSDALEGLRMVKNRNRIPAINEKIRERMAAPADKKVVPFRYKTITSIAAGLVLAVLGTFMFYYFMSNHAMDNVAELQQEHETMSNMDSVALPVTPNEEHEPAAATETRNTGVQKDEVMQEEAEKTDALARKSNTQVYGETPQAPVVAGNSNSPFTAVTGTTDGSYSYNTELAKVKAPDNTRQNTVMEEGNDADKTLEEVVIMDRSSSKGKYEAKDDSKDQFKELQEITKNAEQDVVVKSQENKKQRAKANSATEQKPAAGAASPAYAPAAETTVIRADSLSTAGRGETFEWMSTVDTEAQYPGGQAAMMQFLLNNFNPGSYKAEELAGTKIFVEFIIDKKGKVKNAIIKKGVNPVLDKEAVRVVNSMPKWAPAVKDGKPVDMKMIVPMRIELK